MTTLDGVGDDSGVLVIRVWREPGAEHPFRARITHGAEEPPATGAATSDPDEVLAAVREWLAERVRDVSPS